MPTESKYPSSTLKIHHSIRGFIFSSTLIFAAIMAASIAVIPIAFVANKTTTENRSQAAANNCCGQSDWNSGKACESSDDWDHGYYACVRGECSACQGSNSSSNKVCGNGKCEAGEDAGSCSADCSSGGSSKSSTSSTSNNNSSTTTKTTCPGESGCYAKCTNGKELFDECPANGAFGTCEAWGQEACKSFGDLESSGKESASEEIAFADNAGDQAVDSADNPTTCASSGKTAPVCYGNTVGSSCSDNGTCEKNGGLTDDGYAVCGCVVDTNPQTCTDAGGTCGEGSCDSRGMAVEPTTGGGSCKSGQSCCVLSDNQKDTTSDENNQDHGDINFINDINKCGYNGQKECINDHQYRICYSNNGVLEWTNAKTCAENDNFCNNVCANEAAPETANSDSDTDGNKPHLSDCNSFCPDADGCTCSSNCNKNTTYQYQTCGDKKEPVCYDLHNASEPCKVTTRLSCDPNTGYYTTVEECREEYSIRSHNQNQQPSSGSTWTGAASFIPCYDINDSCNETKKESCNTFAGLYSDKDICDNLLEQRINKQTEIADSITNEPSVPITTCYNISNSCGIIRRSYCNQSKGYFSSFSLCESASQASQDRNPITSLLSNFPTPNLSCLFSRCSTCYDINSARGACSATKHTTTCNSSAGLYSSQDTCLTIYERQQTSNLGFAEVINSDSQIQNPQTTLPLSGCQENEKLVSISITTNGCADDTTPRINNQNQFSCCQTQTEIPNTEEENACPTEDGWQTIDGTCTSPTGIRITQEGTTCIGLTFAGICVGKSSTTFPAVENSVTIQPSSNCDIDQADKPYCTDQTRNLCHNCIPSTHEGITAYYWGGDFECTDNTCQSPTEDLPDNTNIELTSNPRLLANTICSVFGLCDEHHEKHGDVCTRFDRSDGCGCAPFLNVCESGSRCMFDGDSTSFHCKNTSGELDENSVSGRPVISRGYIVNDLEESGNNGVVEEMANVTGFEEIIALSQEQIETVNVESWEEFLEVLWSDNASLYEDVSDLIDQEGYQFENIEFLRNYNLSRGEKDQNAINGVIVISESDMLLSDRSLEVFSRLQIDQDIEGLPMETLIYLSYLYPTTQALEEAQENSGLLIPTDLQLQLIVVPDSLMPDSTNELRFEPPDGRADIPINMVGDQAIPWPPGVDWVFYDNNPFVYNIGQQTIEIAGQEYVVPLNSGLSHEQYHLESTSDWYRHIMEDSSLVVQDYRPSEIYQNATPEQIIDDNRVPIERYLEGWFEYGIADAYFAGGDIMSSKTDGEVYISTVTAFEVAVAEVQGIDSAMHEGLLYANNYTDTNYQVSVTHEGENVGENNMSSYGLIVKDHEFARHQNDAFDSLADNDDQVIHLVRATGIVEEETTYMYGMDIDLGEDQFALPIPNAFDLLRDIQNPTGENGNDTVALNIEIEDVPAIFNLLNGVGRGDITTSSLSTRQLGDDGISLNVTLMSQSEIDTLEQNQYNGIIIARAEIDVSEEIQTTGDQEYYMVWLASGGQAQDIDQTETY